MPFGGETYDPDLDKKRLTAQLYEVWLVMHDGQWRTLGEIAAIIAAKRKAPAKFVPTQSVSARLRDFRKSKFQKKLGEEMEVERRRIGPGLYQYRVLRGRRPS